MVSQYSEATLEAGSFRALRRQAFHSRYDGAKSTSIIKEDLKRESELRATGRQIAYMETVTRVYCLPSGSEQGVAA